MKVYIDVYYYTDDKTGKEYAHTVAGLFNDYSDLDFVKVIVTRTDNIAIYELGNFYKRELPPIIDVLNEIKKQGYSLDTIIVDGFVHMCEDDSITYHEELGARLKDYLLEQNIDIPVIGIAKHPYKYLYKDTYFEYNNNIIKYEDFNKSLKLSKKNMYITFSLEYKDDVKLEIVKEIYAMKKVQKDAKFSLLFTKVDQITKEYKHGS